MFLLLHIKNFLDIKFIKMQLRNSFYILLCSLFLTSLSACLSGDDTEDFYYISTDAQITGLLLSHDSIPALGNAKFSIDQVRGIVYNHDSLPYLTKITTPVILAYATGSGLDGNMLTVVGRDSIWVQSGDSVDISKVSQFEIFATSGLTKKYSLIINIHQIDPDSIQYTQIASEQPFLSSGNNKTVKFNNTYFTYVKDAETISLYQSADMITWENALLTGLPENTVVKEIQSCDKALFAVTETGELYISLDGFTWQNRYTEYPITSILGYMPAGSVQKEGLAAIVQKENGLVFSFIQEIFSTTLVALPPSYGNVVPANFPLSAFSAVYSQSPVLNKITLVGGVSSSNEDLNTVWITEDGFYWVLLSKEHGNLPLVKGGNAFVYNGKLYFAGGLVGDTFNNNFYSSIDGGMTWREELSKIAFPDSFGGRFNASLIVDDEDISFYIIGGMKEDGLSARTDIWKGSLNSQVYQK